LKVPEPPPLAEKPKPRPHCGVSVADAVTAAPVENDALALDAEQLEAGSVAVTCSVCEPAATVMSSTQRIDTGVVPESSVQEQVTPAMARPAGPAAAAS